MQRPKVKASVTCIPVVNPGILPFPRKLHEGVTHIISSVALGRLGPSVNNYLDDDNDIDDKYDNDDKYDDDDRYDDDRYDRPVQSKPNTNQSQSKPNLSYDIDDDDDNDHDDNDYDDNDNY